jgi:hypothetical protein
MAAAWAAEAVAWQAIQAVERVTQPAAWAAQVAWGTDQVSAMVHVAISRVIGMAVAAVTAVIGEAAVDTAMVPGSTLVTLTTITTIRNATTGITVVSAVIE